MNCAYLEKKKRNKNTLWVNIKRVRVRVEYNTYYYKLRHSAHFTPAEDANVTRIRAGRSIGRDLIFVFCFYYYSRIRVRACTWLAQLHFQSWRPPLEVNGNLISQTRLEIIIGSHRCVVIPATRLARSSYGRFEYRLWINSFNNASYCLWREKKRRKKSAVLFFFSTARVNIHRYYIIQMTRETRDMHWIYIL